MLRSLSVIVILFIGRDTLLNFTYFFLISSSYPFLFIIVLLRPVLVFRITVHGTDVSSTFASFQVWFTTFTFTYCVSALMILGKLPSATLTLFSWHFLFLLAFHFFNFKNLLSSTQLHVKSVIKNVIVMIFLNISRVYFLE